MSRHAGLLRRGAARGLRVVVAIVAVGLCSAAFLSAPASSAAAGCPHANAQPGQATLSQLRGATLCLLNRARAGDKLDPLTANRDLNRMAKSHTKAMLAGDCLKHVCGRELSPQERLKKSGYLDGATSWSFAEELGYESTAKQMVTRWLSTTLVRQSLLSPKYLDVGIGPATGAPDPGVDDTSFVAYTVDLAARNPRR